MSKTIDEKVVSMQFDNKNFEANVNTSLSTLDKLKKKLNLDGASKGLEKINSAVKNFDVSPLSSGVEAVKNKFSAMEVMGVTALANITNSAVNAGKRLVSAFTIDPVKTGFQEYELKMGSVQTIMASTGESLATVNKYLDELNTYSDKTIYSFSDMTTNIGKFTNAGVKLEDAVMAIKGISNEAAVSGANTNEASRAMYNFSQALSSGYVKLIDWKSIENANMATVEFKQQLIESAVACGTLTKSAEGMYTTGKHTIDATHEFNDSLQDGWMTSEVLVKTLKDYADETTAIGKKAFSAAQDVKTFSMMMDTLKEAAQSGWAKTWELIFGDFEEAKTLWTELSEKFGSIIDKSSKNRNSILAGALNSKWDTLVGKINDAGIATEDFEGKLKETAKEHGIAIDDLIEKEGSLAKVISSGKISGSVIIETIKKFAGAEKEASTSVDDLTGKLEYYQNVVDKVWRGDYKNADTGRYELLKKEGYDYIAVQELVNRTVDGHRLTMEDLVAVQAEMSDAQLENIGYTEEQVKAIRQLADEAEKTGTPINDLIKNLEKPSGRELLIDSIRNSIQAISVALGAVKGAWKDVFPTSLNEKASMLYKMIEAIHKFTEWLILSDSAADNLKKTFRGLFAAFDIVRTIVGGGLSVGFRILKAVLDAFNIDILSATANIGDAIYAFRNWLLENNIVVKSIEKLISMISKAVTKVKDFADEFAKIPAVSSAITKVKDDVSGAFSEIHDRFSNGGEVITAFIDRCSKLDGISLENIKTVLVDFRDNVLGYFFNTEGLFDNFGASLTNLKDTIISNLEKSVDGFAEFKNKVVEAFEYIKSKLEKIQLGHVIAIGTGIALIAFVNKFWDIAKLIGSPLKTIADSISGFFNSIGGVLKGFTLNLKAKALMKIAIAIAVLVASVALLTRLDAVSLWNAVGALAVLSGVLVGIMIALDKVSVNTNKMIAVGLAIAAMGSSLLFIGAALKIIATMSLEDVGKGLLVITSFGIIAAGLVAFSKLAGEHASKAGTMIMKISSAFILLSIAMKIIASMSDEDAAKGLIIIGILELLAIGLVAVSKLAGDSSDSAGKMIQRIAKAFLILAVVIKIISLMNENDLEKGLVVISTLELLAIGLVAFSKLAGDSSDSAGKMMQRIAKAFLILLLVIKIISLMNDNDLEKGLVVISTLELLVIGLVAVSKLAGEHASKAGTMIMKISSAFIVLALAMAIISTIDAKGLKQAIKAISAVSVCFAALIAVSKFASGAEAAIGKLAIVLAIMAISLAGLSMIDPSRLATATIALSAVIGMFTLLTIATKTLEKINAKKAVPLLLSLAAIIGILAGIIAALSFADPTSTLAAAGSLSALLLSLATSCEILSVVGKSANKALPAAFAMSGIVAILAIILGIFISLNLGPTLEIAASLSILLLSLSTSCLILAAASSVASMASAGAMGLVAVIGTMMILATAIGALATYIPQVQDFVNNAVPIFAKLGEAIGSFIGGIIGGSLSGITDSLPKIGSDIQTFFNSIGSVDSASIDSAKSIAEMLLLITGAEFLDGISKFIGSNGIDQFGARLVSFGGSMSLFASTIKDADIDDDQVEAAANAGKLMAALESSIPRSGGNLQSFIGEHDMTKLGTDMVSFASSMILFSDTIKDADIDEEQVEAAANAGKLMAALEESIPRTGGNLQSFIGDHDMQAFGADIISFANSMILFSDTIKDADISEEAVGVAARCGEMMAALEESIPRTGGNLQSFIGDHDMIKLGTDMVSFGNSMILFSDTIKDGDIDEEAVGVAARCGEMMAALEESIPATDGFLQDFTGEHDMATFGANLVSFGGSITLFAAAIKDSDIDEAKVEAAANAGSAIAKMSEDIPKTGSIFDVFTGNGDLSAFSTDIANFGKGIKNFSDSISGSSYTSITTGLDSAELMVNFMKENGNNIQDLADIILYINNMTWFDTGFVNLGNCVTKFSDSVKTINAGNIENAISAINGMIKIATTISIAPSSNDKITAFGTQIVDLAKAVKAFIAEAAGIDGSQLSIAVAQIKTMSQGLNEASSKSLSGFAKAFDNATKSSKSAASSLVKAVENSFTNVKNADFSKAGKTVISRFADGMTSNSGKAKNAATTVSSDVSLSLKSKKSGAYDAGKALVTGFANGISSNTYIAKNAAREMAKASVKAAKKALDINSPSKVFRKIGKSVPEGFAQGIDRLGGLVDDSATNMCKSAVTQTGKAIARISNAINDNVDAEPTIRPVLDLSNVTNGASAINGLFSTNPSIGVLSNVGSISSMMNRRQNGENNDMVTAINKLNSKLDNISGNTYTVNGITYDDGSNISDAVRALIRATRVERRA